LPYTQGAKNGGAGMKIVTLVAFLMVGFSAMAEGVISRWEDSFASSITSVQVYSVELEGPYRVDIRGKSGKDGKEILYMIPVNSYADASALARDAKGSARINCTAKSGKVSGGGILCELVNVYYY
jgi:hypothetical protein